MLSSLPSPCSSPGARGGLGGIKVVPAAKPRPGFARSGPADLGLALRSALFRPIWQLAALAIGSPWALQAFVSQATDVYFSALQLTKAEQLYRSHQHTCLTEEQAFPTCKSIPSHHTHTSSHLSRSTHVTSCATISCSRSLACLLLLTTATREKFTRPRLARLILEPDKSISGQVFPRRSNDT